ncbi:hypothetical protein HK102_011512, partial [Quaeritorhiza haematococci]
MGPRLSAGVQLMRAQSVNANVGHDNYVGSGGTPKMISPRASLSKNSVLESRIQAMEELAKK